MLTPETGRCRETGSFSRGVSAKEEVCRRRCVQCATTYGFDDVALALPSLRNERQL
jgi:hypothetical protein